MPYTETRYKHVVLDENGVPFIEDTTMKVVELVLEHLAYGWSPAELHFQHPYLSLGQIHSSLAFYWDHRKELETDIDRRLTAVDEVRRSVKPASIESLLRLRRASGA